MIPNFRAWTGTEMRCDIVGIDWDESFGVHNAWLGNNIEYNADNFLMNVILMQYTGLKDKDGVEIYEGDIIKFIGTYKDNKGKELGRYKVVWHDHYTGFYPLINDHLRGNIEWKVIGNIYENPELLKEQNK